MEPPVRYDWSEQQIEGILENIREDQRMILADERLWQPLKKRHLQLAKRFLDFERQWAKDYPQSRILAREKQFEFYLNPQSGALSQTPDPQSFRIAGKIDRIDGDGKKI